MTLLAVERIKLFSTRSPWWCMFAALVVTVGIAAVMSAASDSVTISGSQTGYTFGMAVVMVLAALAVTTEYRFGTIRTTFQAVPRRGAALTAKAVVAGLLSAFIGLLAGFGSWAIAKLLSPGADLALNSTDRWINVAGISVVYGLAAVIAVAVGILVRQSAGAVSLLLIYMLAVENLVRVIPTVGDKIYAWLPFTVADRFISGTGQSTSSSPLSPGWALAYFAGVAVVFLAIAIAVAKKRDA
ncbi:ABC transporter permease [Amycolatopsis oliviviridis]|uniref:ABC transporter permease n=1 Tax=Amycolatopsis oliviviridis TaxID=1471590 RepID=A0ABQ3M082_9PSEU|nr:ABC transporter permease [Amycolatopsis oliviviridis]GHH30053.1 ABC transporter permease [Amycolatopsis oliviviridis]